MTNGNERFIVNIGGRNQEHYVEAMPIAKEIAIAVAEAQNTMGDSVSFISKNGGLTGSMQVFAEAYRAQRIPYCPVLTIDLDVPKYAPPIAGNSNRKIIKQTNSERLDEIIKAADNWLLVVTSGGTGTLEELCSYLCENEFRIKWPQQALGKPFPAIVVGDTAAALWRPILAEVFKQVIDTHPLVESSLSYVSTEYVKNGFLAEEIRRVLTQ